MTATRVAEPEAAEELDAAQQFVQGIGGATQLPAFVRNIRSIATVAADLQVRVELLEKEILKDPALTARVLRVASCAGQGASITSVKQAIIRLGHERVINLSASAAVFDKLERDSAAVHDLLVMSVLTANQGLSLAVRAGHGRPEMAYLCGLFSNLGEIIVACYGTGQYGQWATGRTLADPAPDGSEARHFGFAFEQVAVLLATQWRMPPEVIQSLHRLVPTEEAPRDRLLHIAQFSADLTRAIYAAPPAETASPDIESLIELFTGPLAMERKAIDAAISEARSESLPALRQMDVSLEGWRQARILESEARAEAIVGSGANSTAAEESVTEIAVRAVLESAVEQRRTAGAPSFPDTLNATLGAGRAAGYSRGVLALSNETFSSVRGRMGSGAGHEVLLHSFEVATNAMFGALAAALDHRTDIFVDMQDAEALRYRRDATLRTLRPRCFTLLPLVLSGRLIGCLYFDSATPVDTSLPVRDLLRMARNHLVVAFRHQRSGTQAS